MTALRAYKEWLAGQGRNLATLDDEKDFGIVRAVDEALSELLNPSIVHSSGRTSIDRLLFELPSHPGLVFDLCIHSTWSEGHAGGVYHINVHTQRPRVSALLGTLDGRYYVTTESLTDLGKLRDYQPDAAEVKRVREESVKSYCVLV